jgi:3',5'-cyclic-nucleotide phosphodiesterase
MGIAKIKLISIKSVTRAWRLPASRFHVYYAVVLVILFNCIATNVWSKAGGGFDIIALGTEGGLRSGNLSAYLIGPHGQPLSVACDAGNLIDGIEAAVQAGNFSATIRKRLSIIFDWIYLTRTYKGLLDHAWSFRPYSGAYNSLAG